MSLVDDDIPAWLESNILSRICDVADRGETLAQMFDRCRICKRAVRKISLFSLK
jgi:hypothetical protein